MSYVDSMVMALVEAAKGRKGKEAACGGTCQCLGTCGGVAVESQAKGSHGEVAAAETSHSEQSAKRVRWAGEVSGTLEYMSGGESAEKHSHVELGGEVHIDVAAEGQRGAEEQQEHIDVAAMGQRGAEQQEQHPRKRREIDVELFPQSKVCYGGSWGRDHQM